MAETVGEGVEEDIFGIVGDSFQVQMFTASYKVEEALFAKPIEQGCL